MPTKKQTISVRLDDAAKQQIEHAARVTKQSAGAFLEKAGEERARQVLLDWATDTYRRRDTSFSELAGETGLAVEEIMLALGDQTREEALDAFLTSCRTVAEATGNQDFLHSAELAVETVRGKPKATERTAAV
jgi:hypothetical protein